MGSSRFGFLVVWTDEVKRVIDRSGLAILFDPRNPFLVDCLSWSAVGLFPGVARSRSEPDGGTAAETKKGL